MLKKPETCKFHKWYYDSPNHRICIKCGVCQTRNAIKCWRESSWSGYVDSLKNYAIEISRKKRDRETAIGWVTIRQSEGVLKETKGCKSHKWFYETPLHRICEKCGALEIAEDFGFQYGVKYWDRVDYDYYTLDVELKKYNKILESKVMDREKALERLKRLKGVDKK